MLPTSLLLEFLPSIIVLFLFLWWTILKGSTLKEKGLVLSHNSGLYSMSSGEPRQQKVEGPKVEAAENAYTQVYCSANWLYYCTNKTESQGMTLSALAHRHTYRVTWFSHNSRWSFVVSSWKWKLTIPSHKHVTWVRVPALIYLAFQLHISNTNSQGLKTGWSEVQSSPCLHNKFEDRLGYT